MEALHALLLLILTFFAQLVKGSYYAQLSQPMIAPLAPMRRRPCLIESACNNGVVSGHLTAIALPKTPSTPRVMSSFGTVAIVGPGLMGGSIGLALKQEKLAKEVIGVVRSDASARRATDAGVVDQATTDLAKAAAKANILVVCTPVGQVAKTILRAARDCRPGTIITDAGSTKQRIVDQVVAGLPSGMEFVGSHPLAGDHKTGPESARADLLADRVVVVTPTKRTTQATTDRVSQFWEALGARVVTMSPAEHDAAVAVTSHTPHAVAAALAAATPADLLELTGGGWRDTTRVAAGSPTLWRDILLDNRDEVARAIEAFEGRLAALKQAVADADGAAIEQQLQEGKLRRDALGS